MKKIYTSIGFLFLLATLNAQNSVEYNTFYNSGEFNFISEATNENVSHGENGLDRIWDFSNLIEGEHAKNWYGEAVEPIESMNPELFQDANLCLQTEANGLNKFWKHQESGLVYLGFETETTLLVLDDPVVNMPYPFSYGQVHSDTGSGTLYSSCYDHTWDCVLNSEVVGVGTLILPNATYKNALKVKRSKVISSTSSRTGNERIYTMDEYIWYVNGVPGPVLEINDWTRDVCYGPTEGVTVNYSTLKNESVASVNGIFEMSVFPNPAQEESRLRIKTDQEHNATLIVRDITGKVYSSESLVVQKGDSYHKVDLAGLNPGIYMVEIVTENERKGNQSFTSKLVVK